MSLTTCLKKMGKSLHAQDKADIYAAARKHRSDGLSAIEAARKAVADQLAKADARVSAEESAQRESNESGPEAPADAGVSRSEPLTRAEIDADVKRVFGTAKPLTRLINSGAVSLITKAQAIQRGLGSAKSLEGVKGLHDGTRGYLITDELQPNEVAGVLTHEIGVHHSMERILGAERFDKLQKAMESFRARGDKDVLAAYAAVPKDTPAHHVNHEAIAYLAEHSANHSITQKLVDATKLFLNRLGVPMSWIKAEPAAVRSIARESLLAESRRGNGSVRYNGRDTLYQKVWHGTPHRDIEKTGFSLQKIGTGEGAQAYGWGMYFAGNKEIAEHYRQTLTKRDEVDFWTDDLRAKLAPSLSRVEVQELGDLGNDMFRKGNLQGESLARWRELKDKQTAYDESVERYRPRGNLYHAEIPEDSDLLDYDKPLSEQPEKVRKALAPLIEQVRDTKRFSDDPTGERIYNALSVRLADGDAPGKLGRGAKAASEALLAAGIPGLRYADGNTRNNTAWTARHPDGRSEMFTSKATAQGYADRNPGFVVYEPDQSHNYVIWDETLLTPEKAQITPYYSKRVDDEGQTQADPMVEASRTFFGTTKDPREAGYILPDGDMLDLTGRHYAEDNRSLRGQRSVDHRELTGENKRGESMDELFNLSSGSGSDYMQEFMTRTGAMRVDFNAGVASIIGEPTQDQIKILANNLRGEYAALSVIDPENGRIVDDAEIENPTAMKVRRFFDQAKGRKADKNAPLFSKRAPSSGEEPTPDDQTQTPAFKRWFAGSKVVDSEGKPLVVYHGTNAEFDAFDPAKVGSAYDTDDQGFFFTSLQDEAQKWADRAPVANNPKVLPVYLSIENAWVIDAPEGMGPVEYFESGKGPFNRGHGAAVQYGIDSGYDGMIVRGEGETMYVAFRPEQIKSATGNNGQFDPGNPDIRFSRRKSDADLMARQQAAESGMQLYQPARTDQTQTTEFKRWFAGSKVVDSEGKPLVVYHGTARDLVGNAFNPDMALSEGGAFYFSHSPLFKNPANNANEYAKGRAGDSPQVMPVYLKMENPLVVGFTEPMPKGDAEIDAWLGRMNAFNRGLDRDKEKFYKRAIREAREGGHDGVIIRNVEDVPNDIGRRFTDEADVYIALEPTQIKSATGNNGQFDPGNPSILKSRRTPELEAAFTAYKRVASELRSEKSGIKEINELKNRAARLIGEASVERDLSAEVDQAREELRDARRAVRKDSSKEELDALQERAVELNEAKSELRELRAKQAAANRALDVLERRESDKSLPDRIAAAEALEQLAAQELKAYKRQRTLHDRRNRATEARKAAEDRRENARNTLGGPTTGGAIGWNFDAGEWEGKSGTARRARAALDDKMIAWRDVQDSIADHLGKTIPDAQNVYRLENLMHGRVKEGIDDLEHKMVEPLVRAMKERGITTEALEEYLYALHAKERNDYIASINPKMPDGGSGMTNAEADVILAKPLPLGMKEIAKRAKAIIRQTRQRMLDHGIITQEQFDAMESQYKNYVPLRGKRVGENEFDSGGGNAGRGIDGRAAPIKQAFGRGAENRAENILGEIIGDAQRSIIAAEKARVGRAVMRIVLANPNPALWTVEPVQTERKMDANGEVYDAVVNDWSDPSIIAVRHRGKVYKVQINHAPLAKALNLVGVDQIGAVTRAAGALNRYFSAVLTRYNPAFIPVNAARDALFGLTGLAVEHGEVTAMKAALYYPKAIRAAWREARRLPPKSQADTYAREFSEDGGKTGYVSMPSVEELQRKIGSGRFGGYSPQGIGRAAQAVGDLVGAMNDSVENALRLSAYVTLREQGMAREKAASYAKELTVNFNRKGSEGTKLNSWFLFYNASMQGIKRTGALMKSPKTWGYLGALTAAQIAAVMYAIGQEDDDGTPIWDKVPDHVKQRNLVFTWLDDGGEQKILTIPMPYGLNVFPYFAGRVADGMMHAENRPRDRAISIAADTVSTAVQSFSPVPLDDGAMGLLPTALRIPLSIQVNRDDFGRQIRKENPFGKFDVPRASIGKPDTLEMFKVMATGLNRIGGGDERTPPPMSAFDVAPEDIEYVLEKLGGGTGKFIIDMATVGQKSTGELPVEARDIPIAKRFFTNVNEPAAQQAMFYERREAIERDADMVRDVYEKDGQEAAIALLRSTPSLSGADFRRYKESDPKKGHRKGGIVVVDGRPQLVVRRPDSVYGRYKAAAEETAEVNGAMRNAYADSPMSLRPSGERDKRLKELADKRMAAQRIFNAAWNRDVVGGE